MTANGGPAETARMCALIAAGQVEEAREIDRRIGGLHHALFVESNPIPVKWAVARMGWMRGAIRLPMTPLSEECHAEVLAAMRGAGVSFDQ